MSPGCIMSEPFNPEEAADHIQAAIDATCAALLALQDASRELERAGNHPDHVGEAERRATELMHGMIRELRRLIGLHTGSPLALGFVRPGSTASAASPGMVSRTRFESRKERPEGG